MTVRIDFNKPELNDRVKLYIVGNPSLSKSQHLVPAGIYYKRAVSETGMLYESQLEGFDENNWVFQKDLQKIVLHLPQDVINQLNFISITVDQPYIFDAQYVKNNANFVNNEYHLSFTPDTFYQTGLLRQFIQFIPLLKDSINLNVHFIQYVLIILLLILCLFLGLFFTHFKFNQANY